MAIPLFHQITLPLLKLLDIKGEVMLRKQQALIGEVNELMKIFGSIIEKVK
jgi:hypothetical protein